MKINTVFRILAAFIAIQLTAQTPITPGSAKAIGSYNFGIKAGVNYSNQNIGYDSSLISLSVDTNTFTSIHFGVYGEFMLSEKLCIQPEVLFSREGSKIDLEFVDFYQIVNFIKVPTLLKLKPFNNGLSFLVGT